MKFDVLLGELFVQKKIPRILFLFAHVHENISVRQIEARYVPNDADPLPQDIMFNLIQALFLRSNP